MSITIHHDKILLLISLLFINVIFIMAIANNKYIINPSTSSKKKKTNNDVGSLSWFTYPLNPQNFIKDYFEVNPVLFNRNIPSYYEDDNSSMSSKSKSNRRPLDELFHYIQQSAYDKKCPSLIETNGFPTIRATNNGKDVKPFLYWNMPEIKQGYDEAVIAKEQSKYQKHQMWDKDAIQYTHSLGFSTLFIRAQQWENTVAKPFLRDVASKLGIYAQMNLYVTPGNKVGFVSHFDSHDVYVLQLYGNKNWRVYQNPPEQLPANDWPRAEIQKYLKRRKANRKHLINTVLKQGNALYIPRGYIHDADCKDLQDDSIHVSVGFFPPLYADLIYYGFQSLLSSYDEDNNHFFNMSFIKRMSLKSLKTTTSKTKKEMKDLLLALKSSPTLPFATEDTNNSNNMQNNFNMYKLAVEAFFNLHVYNVDTFKDLTTNVHNNNNNELIVGESEMKVKVEQIKNDLMNEIIWESIKKQYKQNLHKFVKDGFQNDHRVYRPVSHDAQEARSAEEYNNEGGGGQKKRKRKHRRKKRKHTKKKRGRL